MIMNKSGYLIVGLLLIIAPQLLFAKSVMPTWYLGTWNFGSCDATKTICMDRNYSFNPDGSFSINGYPPLKHSGRFRITSITEDQANMELYEQQGDMGSGKTTIHLQFNTEKKSLLIDNEGPYQNKSDNQ